MFWNPWCSRIVIIMEIFSLPIVFSFTSLERPAQATPTMELNIHFSGLHIPQVHLLRPSLLSDGRPAPFLLSLVSLPSTLALPKRLQSRANMFTNLVARHWVRILYELVATTLVTSQEMPRSLQETIEFPRRDCWCHGLQPLTPCTCSCVSIPEHLSEGLISIL